jgi:DNA-binding CsgD family transcriptional regulator
MGAVIAVQGAYAPTLTSNRGCRKPKFSEEERKIAQFLLPHLQRAWALYRRLHFLSAGESVMDSLSQGIVFLADSGTVIYCNRAAETILRAGDGISLQNGALCTTRSNSNGELRQAIRHAISPATTHGREVVFVARSSWRRPYQIVVAPLRNRFRQFVATPAPVAVAIITDPEQQQSTNVQLLIQSYKLTPKEAELAVRLSAGKTVGQAAAEMGITYETARTHVRRIFSKTGTSRQAELLLLIARLASGQLNHG